jgi:hypothetical protein
MRAAPRIPSAAMTVSTVRIRSDRFIHYPQERIGE